MECPKCGELMTTMIHLGPNGVVGWTEKCFFCEYAQGNTAIPENITRDLKNETAMPTPKGTRTIKQSPINKLIAAGMLVLGLVFLALSALYNLYVSAFVGLGLTFWGALLLYVTPTKHVNLELLNATLKPALLNNEEMLTHFKLNEKGIYLPPRYLKDFESSLIYIPSKKGQALPNPEEVGQEKLYSKNPNGVFLNPYGAALSKLFEQELGASFAKTDLKYVQEKLPKLLTENMEIAEDMEIETENNSVTVEITNHIFKQICEETEKLPKTQETMGSPLASAIACVLTKATGKPITIQKEEHTEDRNKTRIQYLILED